MGKRQKGIIKFMICGLLLVLINDYSYAQTKVSGLVTNKNNSPLYAVSILLKDSINKAILKYTYTDNNGNYVLETNKTGKFNITFSSLGYASKTMVFTVEKTQTNSPINVVLKEKPFALDEVTINAENPILIKKDTITFKTRHFTNGTEQTVEDLLKTIPGLNIDSNGTIKVGNQEIEKLMIDGDDLFERGYKILSKNMPAYPIEEVEILKRYSNNRLLKGIEESNKVALNLKLNKKSKRVWFGNIKVSSDLKNSNELLSNLMNFGNKNKYYFLTNLNNIGKDATGNIEHLIRPFRYNEPASIGDNQQVRELISLPIGSLEFKKSRTNFNDTKLLSLNAIFNPTKKLKIKTLGFFNWDENSFFRNATDIVTTSNTNFTNTENFKLQNKKTIGFGKLDFSYNISKTKMLESTIKYNKQKTNGQANLLFNGASTIENLQTNNTLFDQKITYSNKFKEKKVLLITGRFIDEKTPQNYAFNDFFYQDLFPGFTNANNVQQHSESQLQFAAIEIHLLDRKRNEDLLEIQFGDTYRKDNLKTVFSLLENTTIIASPTDFQNKTEYKTNNLYFKTKYRYKIKNIAVTGNFDLHQLFNHAKINGFSEDQTAFFANPNIGVDWKINEKNKITSSYSYNITNAKILDVSTNYILTGFRSFLKGTGDFNQLDTSTILFNYQLGNWSDRFFANTFIFYKKNFNFFSTNTILNQNYTKSERILIKNRRFLSVSTKFDYYFKKISSNLKLNLGYSKSTYKNSINSSNLREVNSNIYDFGLELRSGFKGVFNYHIGTKWKTNKIETTTTENSFTNNVSFVDLSFVFNEDFNMSIQTERYQFGNLHTQNNTYYFLDFDARYTIKKNKLSIAITGKNLFNTKDYITSSISDIGSSTTAYKLLERFVLLKLEYRF